MISTDSSCITMPQPTATATKQRRLSLGLPASSSNDDLRFPLTPEGADILVQKGFEVRIETGAASAIHYSDARFMQYGANVVTRQEALEADIVIHLAPLSVSDIKMMRRGAMLLSILHTEKLTASNIRALLDRRIIAVAIDHIRDDKGNTPFYDILMEVDGRASIALASSMLASPDFGKGILLGGVAGVNPCEVTILGSGIAARAAASSALGSGAIVNMFDNDVYRIRESARLLGPGVVVSSMHPRVLEKALRGADVVVATPQNDHCTIGPELLGVMKSGAIVMDLNHDESPAFPSLPAVDIATLTHTHVASPGRHCYINLGNAVPRTAAMALTNTFLSLMHEIISCEGVADTVKLLPGIQSAVYTFLGKPVNRQVADIVKMRSMDINLLLNCS
ncbi:MAG: hypothetical protein NC127_06710 [Muribaculum sp.]|nr:hypothetical protein [Muribaculum sp.]